MKLEIDLKKLIPNHKFFYGEAIDNTGRIRQYTMWYRWLLTVYGRTYNECFMNLMDELKENHDIPNTNQIIKKYLYAQ